MAESETYDERFENFHRHLKLDMDFLSQVFCEQDLRHPDTRVADITEEEFQNLCDPEEAFYPYPDPGPREILMWAYRPLYADYLYAGGEQ